MKKICKAHWSTHEKFKWYDIAYRVQTMLKYWNKLDKSDWSYCILIIENEMEKSICYCFIFDYKFSRISILFFLVAAYMA